MSSIQSNACVSVDDVASVRVWKFDLGSASKAKTSPLDLDLTSASTSAFYCRTLNAVERAALCHLIYHGVHDESPEWN